MNKSIEADQRSRTVQRKSAVSKSAKSATKSTTSNKQREVALSEARALIEAQDAALRDIRAKWQKAELEREAYGVALANLRATTLYRYGELVRFLGKNFPASGAWIRRLLDLVYAALSFRLGTVVNERRFAAALIEEDRAVILASGLFDEDWYVGEYPDAKRYKNGPLEHFLRHGTKDGRNPNAAFCTGWYVTAYSDVAASRRNPLAHYQLYGSTKGYQPAPDFDAVWYAKKHAKLIKGGVSALQHYVQQGQDLHLPKQPLDDVKQLGLRSGKRVASVRGEAA